MSYEKMLTDRCDIYHLKTKESDGDDFGIPKDDMQEEAYYDDEPDESDVKCYFTEKNQSISQGEPNAVITQSYSVHFPVSTDIRTNSKVVWEDISLKSEKPRTVKGHHIEVTMNRDDNL